MHPRWPQRRRKEDSLGARPVNAIRVGVRRETSLEGDVSIPASPLWAIGERPEETRLHGRSLPRSRRSPPAIRGSATKRLANSGVQSRFDQPICKRFEYTGDTRRSPTGVGSYRSFPDTSFRPGRLRRVIPTAPRPAWAHEGAKAWRRFEPALYNALRNEVAERRSKRFSSCARPHSAPAPPTPRHARASKRAQRAHRRATQWRDVAIRPCPGSPDRSACRARRRHPASCR